MELDQLQWIDVRDFGIEGKGWTDTESCYDRLPARAKGVVPQDVWNLGHHTTGLRVHFTTDSPVVAADWTVPAQTLASDRMPPIGGSGLDLYMRRESGWRWAAVASSDIPPARTRRHLLPEMTPGRHEYMLYLPILNSVGSLSIGTVPGTELSKPRPQPGKPICYYGTSIVHGAFATRPGMTYPAILGRRLDVPFLNLGFAGCARMEPEMSQLLAELDPRVYVLDTLPNMSPEMVTNRAEPFVRTLRKAHPKTPIVLVENILFEDAAFTPDYHGNWRMRNEALRTAYQQLLKAGIRGLHYVPQDNLVGDDGEWSLDGVHPTDVGFLRMADALATVLRPIA